MHDEKKMGRPTDNPKPYRVNVRLDEERKEILDTYAEQEKISAMEAVRRAIKRLRGELKKMTGTARTLRSTRRPQPANRLPEGNCGINITPYGNLTPEAPFFGRDPRYTQAMRCEKLLGQRRDTDLKIFQAYVDMQGEVNRLTAVKNLVYGFRLGLLMTAESFAGMDELYKVGIPG